MGQEAGSSEATSIQHLQAILPEHSCVPKGDGYEVVVFPSNIDNALTFFVSFPKAKMDAPKGRATPTEPEAD